ncbi:MAG: hypothetical protein MR022_09420, partial [Ruminococcus sp.]|nr:hypothetical protein [Ruminococcus sp.]
PKTQLVCGTKLYMYEVHQLKPSDVVFLNSLLIGNADSYIGFAEPERIKQSFEYCKLQLPLDSAS